MRVRVLLCASERRGGLGNRFFLLLRLLLLLLRINALVTKFSDLFLCSLSLCYVFCVIYYVFKNTGGDVYVQRVHHRLVPHSEIQLDVFTTVGSVLMHRDDLWSDNQFHHAR